MALAHLEIVEVMGRRDLDRAAAGGGIGVLVGDHRNQAIHQRQANLSADQGAIPLIVRMNGDGGIAQHGFRPGGGDHDETPRLALHRVSEMPEVALDLALIDLEIRNGRVQLRVPIHQPLVAIDQSLAMQIDEDLAHGMAQPLIHGKALARPIGGCAKPAKLADDGSAGFALPFPDLFQEGRAVDGGGIGAGAEARQHDPLLGKLSFHYHLGGDTGMVGAGLPQHVATAHALIADENILQGEGQGMAHVQAARHIGWRHHDGEGLGRR